MQEKTKRKVEPTVYVRREDKKRLNRIRDDNDLNSIPDTVKYVLDVYEKAVNDE